MVSIELVHDDSHPEGGHAFLNVVLDRAPQPGDFDLRIHRSDGNWLHPGGWGEGGALLPINAANVRPAGSRWQIKLGPEIVDHLTVGTSYSVECPLHGFKGHFRVQGTIKIGSKSVGGKAVDGATVTPNLTRTGPRTTGGPVTGEPPRSGGPNAGSEPTGGNEPSGGEPDDGETKIIDEPPPIVEPPPKSDPPGKEPTDRRKMFAILGGLAAVAVVTASLAHYYWNKVPVPGVGRYDGAFIKALDAYDKLRAQIGQ